MTTARALAEIIRVRQLAKIKAMDPHDRSVRIRFVVDQLLFRSDPALLDELGMLERAERDAIIEDGVAAIRSITGLDNL